MSSFLLAVDGSRGSDKAVEFVLDCAKKSSAKVIVAYVIEWSPYSFNTPEENAERHQRRNQEIDRATSSIVDPVVARLKKAGIDATGQVRHGHPARTLAELATQNNASQIFIGRLGDTDLKSMIFGSVAANLVQTSSVPVTVVP